MQRMFGDRLIATANRGMGQTEGQGAGGCHLPIALPSLPFPLCRSLMCVRCDWPMIISLRMVIQIFVAGSRSLSIRRFLLQCNDVKIMQKCA